MSAIDLKIAETERTLADLTRKYNLREQANQAANLEHQRQVRDCGGRDFLQVAKDYAAEHDVSLNAAMRKINVLYPQLYSESKAKAMVQYS